MDFGSLRDNLRALLVDHISFSQDAEVDPSAVADVAEQLKTGELSVAVVGEINRGKSTFLNALMGATVFPSRVMICTAGITVLDHGEEPRAQVVYKDGTTKEVDLRSEDPSTALKKIVSRTNKDVKDIEVTQVWYPNPFTRRGIILVDTPGVNDPDHWREEITYSYLAQADAVIMLLDPMQPLSASEVEFLDSKILERSIANLIFVVNKIDDVPQADRSRALSRIESMLSKYVPNPKIYPVAAKPALQAKLSGDTATLQGTGFSTFEKGLLEFLSKGRGGLLLQTKIQQGADHLEDVHYHIAQRQGALDEEKGAVEAKVNEAKRKLDILERRRNKLKKDLGKERNAVTQRLHEVVQRRKDYLTDSLQPSIAKESNVVALREQGLRFQRDSIAALRDAVESEFDGLLSAHNATSQALTREVRDVLGNLSREATQRVNSLNVQRRERTRDRASAEQRRKAGAAIGGGVGAAAGAAVAASATTTTLTATGAIATSSALGTMGVIGVGALTGGVGLLVGLGIAALMSDDGDESKAADSQYVNSEEIVNNRKATIALRSFINRMNSSIAAISSGIINSARKAVLRPIDNNIDSQRQLIQQVRADLSKTTDAQQDLRKVLSMQSQQARQLKGRYNDLNKAVQELR